MGYSRESDIRDPFYDKQPPKSFIEELKKPYHRVKPDWFCRTAAEEGEAEACGAYIVSQFFDPEGLLDTVLEDFALFGKVYGVGGNRYPIYLVQGETPCFEAYSIQVEADRCTVTAADTEGLRRAVIFIEDEMLRREGPFLPLGKMARRPLIKNRITKSYMTPPKFGAELIDCLLDDVDNFPGHYLDRLVHDGCNGVWLDGWLRDLVNTSFFQVAGADADRRIAKLRQIVAQCKRYGVKVYTYGVEPECLTAEMARQHPEMVGYQVSSDKYTVCTHTQAGEQYCIEMTQRLFEQVPDLGGLLLITDGERATQCVSCSSGAPELCPRCSKENRGEVLAHTIDLLKEGIRRAGSDGELICWTYGFGHGRGWEEDEICEYVRRAPHDVALMQNFENGGVNEQLGKPRLAMDYWLSYTGPARLMDMMAQEGRAHGKSIYAKLQVSCCHEMESVPYIPVPGIMYDKISYCVENGVSGFVGCWALGNHPGIMYKAACEMSFTDPWTDGPMSRIDKQAFLEYICGISFGRVAGAQAAKAMALFEKGYVNYPTNIMFGYYGPMHDGVVWPLYLQPRNLPLPRSWHVIDFVGGDRIGDCLQLGHTLDEAVELCRRMAESWTEGMGYLPASGCDELCNISAAVGVLLNSGYRILRFYQLREQLLDGTGDPYQQLAEMRRIVEQEMQASTKMIGLWKENPGLGYCTHAPGYKFFPEKLQWRVEKLRELLDTEFVEANARVERGEKPIDYSMMTPTRTEQMTRGSVEDAPWQTADNGNFTYRVAYDEQNLQVEIRSPVPKGLDVGFEFRPMWASPRLQITINGLCRVYPVSQAGAWAWNLPVENAKYAFENRSSEGNWQFLVKADRKKCGWVKDTPVRIRVAAGGQAAVTDPNMVRHLGKESQSPGEYLMMLP